jgi:murein DD-endopeptidase MepM/ murein hydrolase activator NlpD
MLDNAEDIRSTKAAITSAALTVRSTQATADGLAAQLTTLDVRIGVLSGTGARLVFPVVGPNNFGDTWGAPRSGGRRHEGTDVIAANGTPLVAVEAGVVTRVDWNPLGGWKLWVDGESGTSYYYAHLRAYAPGIAPGGPDFPVAAGQLIGWVGQTGNAQFSVSHLHIEVHPQRGAPINPYPLMRALAAAPPPALPAAAYQPPAPLANGGPVG